MEQYLNIEDKLDFFRELDNQYDKQAIMIKTASGVKIGYVPKQDNVIFARLMDAGKLLFGRITAKEKRVVGSRLTLRCICTNREVFWMKPIYFSKVEFVEILGYGMRKSVMLLDLEKRELSYQVFVPMKREMPAIQGIETISTEHFTHTYDVSYPARVIRNGKNGFNRQLIQSEWDKYEIVFSDGIKLTDEHMKKLLPYCNALDFEPYRNKKMSMDDEGYIGYRDEISTYFTGITNSHIPKLELPMEYYYDEEHIWPSEKLYRYLVRKFYKQNKKYRQYGPSYGGHSLFWG